MMAPDDDLTPSLLQAFTDRHLSMAPSGQFLAEQEASDAQTKDAERQTAARDWLRSQGLGDSVPSPADYDYGRMLDDGVYPSKDAAGRVPLPPQYWKPGRMLIGGRDIATGQRIASRVPLEDRILSGVEDDEPDDGDGISTLTQDDIAELSARERRGLEAWMESHGVMIAAGPSQTRTDAPTGYYPRPNRPPTLDDLKQRGTDVWDVLAGALKGGVAQTLGLPGDVESLIRMLTGGEQVMPTTEDMEKKLPLVIPPTLSSLVTGGGQREANAAYGETAGEFIGLGKAPTAVARGVVKGAKVLAPTARDMFRRGADRVVDATGARMRIVPDEQFILRPDAYPKAGATVDGRTVRDTVPNTSSIASTLDDYEELPGIRQVPVSAFPGASVHDMFYAANDHERVRKLAGEIKASREISPLIVVVDKEGPYVLEGGHRLAALHSIGAKSLPALVVIDKSNPPAAATLDALTKAAR